LAIISILILAKTRETVFAKGLFLIINYLRPIRVLIIVNSSCVFRLIKIKYNILKFSFLKLSIIRHMIFIK